MYKITNTVTGDFYIGSSKNVKQRWAGHRCPSMLKKQPNSKMYQDMQKYGVDKFNFQILAPVMPGYLKQVEQEFIEMLQPTYNKNRSNGWDVERRKERQKKYRNSEKVKKHLKEYQKRYGGQVCEYNGETFTLKALLRRFQKSGVEKPAIEAKKYLKNI